MAAASIRMKLIANPVAGRRGMERISRAAQTLTRLGAKVDLSVTQAPGDARLFAMEARAAGFDRIVVAGGDGTLNEVINGLAPSSTPLAFIPMGTTNVFALEAGIPFEIEAACRIAVNGKLQAVSLGLAGTSRFLLMAGVGLDAEAVYRLDPGLKRRTGKAAYLFSGMKALMHSPPRPLKVESGTPALPDAGAVIIGNGRLYGGRFSVTPAASLFKNSLEVCLLFGQSRLRLLRTMARIAAGRSPRPDEAMTFSASELRVSTPDAPVQIDGDYLGRTPMSFSSTFGEIMMMFPAQEA